MAFSRIVASALLAIFVSACCVEGEGCKESWTECHDVVNKLRLESTIVCCEDPALVPEVHKLPDDAINCTCVSRMKHKYDLAIQAWAQKTASQGRMCEYEEGCSGSKSNSSINERFTFCCRKQPSHTLITVYDGDYIEYVGCRCVGDPIPTNPDTTAYVVPETGQYSSSGETCSYNAMCDDHPVWPVCRPWQPSVAMAAGACSSSTKTTRQPARAHRTFSAKSASKTSFPFRGPKYPACRTVPTRTAARSV